MDGTAGIAQTPLREDQGPALFRALADPIRQKLLQILLAEELSVGEIVILLRLPQSTVSRHLRVLRSAGLVIDRREATTAFYRAVLPTRETDGLRPLLLAWLKDRGLPKSLKERLARAIKQRDDTAGGFFQRLGKRWDELREAAFGDAFAGEAFLSLLPREWTVADIGTGTGFLLPALADNFKRVIAVDPAPAMLECARQRATGHGARNVTFRRGDLNRLPLRDGACELAVACLVLHHVATPAQALREMHRVLRPGGRLLIIEQQAHENQAFYETMQDQWWGFEPANLAKQTRDAGFHDTRHHLLRPFADQRGRMESPGLFVLSAARSASKRK